MADLSSNFQQCLICHYFEQPQNKYFCKIKIIFFAINQFQTMQTLQVWKKKKKKKKKNYFF